MKPNFKNIVKCIIFYSTILMGFITLGIDFDRTPGTTLFWWMSILVIFVSITYKMCSGKTGKDIKEFTGIDFGE